MTQAQRINNELQALRNMAEGTGLEVHFKFTEDKRKSVPKYYATQGWSIYGTSIGPVLEYWPMCNFLLGFRKAMQLNGLLPHDPF